MLGGWRGLLSSTARGPSGPFCFSSAGVDVFRLHCICDASIFVAFVSYCGVHATRRFLLHLYLIAMSMRRVDSLENSMQALHYHSKWDRVAPPYVFPDMHDIHVSRVWVFPPNRCDQDTDIYLYTRILHVLTSQMRRIPLLTLSTHLPNYHSRCLFT